MNLSLLQGVCEVESHNILYHSMSDNKNSSSYCSLMCTAPLNHSNENDVICLTAISILSGIASIVIH